MELAKGAPEGHRVPFDYFYTTMGLKAFLAQTFSSFFDLCIYWVSVVNETVPS